MLTEKQKEAIDLLIKLRVDTTDLTLEEFFLLLEFVMGNQQPTQYLHWPVETPNPIYPGTTYPWVTYEKGPTDFESLKYTTTSSQEVKNT